MCTFVEMLENNKNIKKNQEYQTLSNTSQCKWAKQDG